MKIETKYNIGDHIWVVYKERATVGIYDEYINEIAINKNNQITYYMGNCEDFEEDKIILYEEKDKLLAQIEKLMEEINEEEK